MQQRTEKANNSPDSGPSGRPGPEPALSVVIPVYNAESFIAERLATLSAYLEAHGGDYELVAVDDGSRDRTAEILRNLSLPRFRPVFCEQNGGKFAALTRGMRAARGRCRLFTDADVPYELAAIPYMARLVLDRGFHVVVGDRTLPGSSYADQLGFVRRVATRVFTLFIRLIVTGGLFDTQCGIKAFRGDVAAALFPLLRESGFAGDVELLYVALKYNLEIKRVPVRLRYTGPSTVSAAADGVRMMKSLMRLRGRHRAGTYRSEPLERIARQFYWDAAPDRLPDCQTS